MLPEAGLPEPERQLEILEPGRLVARVDLAYPAQHLIIEADGYRWHFGRAVWQRDLDRQNHRSRWGGRLLHLTWEGVHSRPRYVAREGRRALEAASVSNFSPIPHQSC